MSAQDNLSQKQFIDVARGVKSDKPSQPLGKHWSSDEAVSMIFADPHIHEKSTVLFGRVHPDSVVKPGTPEHDRMAENYAIHGPDSIEREVTVRPGSTVNVTGQMRRTGKRDRMITYSRPRKMQA